MCSCIGRLFERQEEDHERLRRQNSSEKEKEGEKENDDLERAFFEKKKQWPGK